MFALGFFGGEWMPLHCCILQKFGG